MMKSEQRVFIATCLSLGWAVMPILVTAQSADNEILVIGVTPGGAGQPLNKIPFAVQTAGSAELERSMSLDLSDFLNSNLTSVNLNAAQNNPLQPDLQYRGFTVSPLLGLPQGLAVYQNGVRINEPLGDAVNWDLLPESAVAGISLLGGANPVFGLNSLGGTLNIDMKDGFNFAGHQAEWTTGAWGRDVASIESGGNNGRWGYYLNASYFDEQGWRDLSASEAENVYASLNWRGDRDAAIDLSLQRGKSELTGNGATPRGLMAIDREAVFTAPDITENDLVMVSLHGNYRLTDQIEISGTVFNRRNTTDSFNGDASEFAVCEFNGGSRALLEVEDVLEDAIEDDLGLEFEELCDGSLAGINDVDDLEDLLAISAINAGLNPEDFELEDLTDELSGTGILSDEAINNTSRRRQVSKGLEGQLLFNGELLSRPNRLVTGFSYFDGQSRFQGELELAELDPISRSTAGLGTGTFVEEAATSITTSTRTWGVYFTDTVDLTERISLTLSGRYNEIDTRLSDRSGERPELNGRHRFSRFNPAVGLTYAYAANTTLFLSYNEANRVPTPIELSCNDQIFSLAREYAEAEGDDPEDVEFECRLPNAFLADPPLDDVVTRNVEAGVRGNANGLIYNIGLFHAVNRDDIIFQTTGRATGLFANVDKTRRMGLETALAGNLGPMDWFASYSQVRATFEDNFAVLSPNHDFADTDGTIAVSRGDHLPGIPRHQFKLGVDFAVTTSLNLGVDGFYNSSQALRGDESNQLDKVDGYQVFNLRATYKFNDIVTLFAKVTNLFDSRYESFGLLGEDPSELLDFISDESPHFFGPGAPRGAWLGARVLF